MIEQIYAISLPQGPLGLTLENILERTIVVSIKPQGLASQAGVEPYSWLVGINGWSIVHLTHKETLLTLGRASRPLVLRFLLLTSPAMC